MHEAAKMPIPYASKVIGKKNSRNQKDDRNFPKYYLHNPNIGSKSYEEMQQRSSYYYFDQNTIQLRQDDAKLVASTYGNDPSVIAGIGLTAHHIIPSGLLEEFYDICKNSNSKSVKKGLLGWEKAAVSAARNSSRHRETSLNLTPRNNPNLPAIVKSACVWMNGNIFIGPSAAYRIDDTGNSFDYGGFRSLGKKQNPWTDVDSGNQKMNGLETLYNQLLKIKQQNQNHTISTKDIESALISLTALAHENNTLHKKEPAANGTLAYDPNDWICIGNSAILGGQNTSELQTATANLIEMYKAYSAYNGQNNTFWNEFCVLFRQNMKLSECHQIWKSNSISRIMAKNTYNMLLANWKAHY